MCKTKKTQVKNYEAIPGIIETISADVAEELGAFIEHALTEKDARETDTSLPYGSFELVKDAPKEIYVPGTAKKIHIKTINKQEKDNNAKYNKVIL